MKSEHVKILVREIEDAREYKGYSGRYRGGEATDAVVVSDPDDKGRAQANRPRSTRIMTNASTDMRTSRKG